jgi:acyl-CoA reductase-like NAD-dependent aldehyde dehydrogenase
MKAITPHYKDGKFVEPQSREVMDSINRTKNSDPQAPWGEFKFSGVGREFGAFGIEAFLELRAILK